MNDQQSTELVIELRRIADALERIAPPAGKSSKLEDLLMQNLGNIPNQDVLRQVEELIKSKAGAYYKENVEQQEPLDTGGELNKNL